MVILDLDNKLFKIFIFEFNDTELLNITGPEIFKDELTVTLFIKVELFNISI